MVRRPCRNQEWSKWGENPKIKKIESKLKKQGTWKNNWPLFKDSMSMSMDMESIHHGVSK